MAIIACRQNLKTGFFKQAALGWLFITDQRLVVWSAHEFSTAQEAHRDMAELIESSDALTRRLKRIYWGNGDEAIELMSGQRLIFKARTKGGGRGLSGDKVVLDEGFALQPLQMGALLPTLSARPDPQVLIGSSAGLADSAVLRGVRNRGRRGNSGRLAYLEWCAPKGGCAAGDDCTHALDVDGCALDNRDHWRAANPAMNRTRRDPKTGVEFQAITEAYIASERQALPPEEFARERLGWWDEPGLVKPAFGVGAWEACGVEAGERPPVAAIGVAVSIDRAWASIGAAAPLPDDRFHVGATERRRGTAWVVSRVRDIQRDHGCKVVIDGRGPGATLIDDLDRAGVDVTVASSGDVLDACAGIYDRVQNGQLEHMHDGELDDAVAGATPRSVGDRWMWGRKTSAFDVSMLEAATLALWGAAGGDSGGFNIW